MGPGLIPMRSGTTKSMTKPKHDHTVQRETVVALVMHWHSEPRELATLRVRRKPWGYNISHQPIEYIRTKNIDHLLYGPGPTIVHGETGVIMSLSSSPADYSGPEGYAFLNSMEYLDRMIAARGISPTETIYELLNQYKVEM